MESSYSADGDVKWSSELKTKWEFFKRLNIELPDGSAIPLFGRYPKQKKTYLHTKNNSCIFIATLFTIAKDENNKNIHRLMNG